MPMPANAYSLDGVPGWVWIGGRSDGVELFARRGFDWVGPAYDSIRSHHHDMAYRGVDRLKADGRSGTWLVWGDLETPLMAWPVVARIQRN